MPRTFTVGEFSRLTHLPVKTLHHYHQVGVLVPASVDPVTGYRGYDAAQVAAAHLARRLRDVRMPLEDVRTVLAAPDAAARDAGIAAHLARLQRELAETSAAVASLHALLGGAPAPDQLADVSEPAQPAVALHAAVERQEIGAWCAAAYPRLFQAVARLGTVPAGPGGALYDPGWFEHGGGTVTAFVPIGPAGPVPGPFPEAHSGAVLPGRVGVVTVPAQRLATIVHAGPYQELDLSYGVLGRHVLDRGAGADGPIRETYLVSGGETDDPAGFRTRIGWPVTDPSTHPSTDDQES